MPCTRTAHLQVIPAAEELHSPGPPHCCQPTASNTLPLSLLQGSSPESKSPALSLICQIIPYQASLAPSSIRNHQSYSKHIRHPHHFLSCLAADLPQRHLKGALMFFVSPFCLAAIKIKSMPSSLSWLFPLQFFFLYFTS